MTVRSGGRYVVDPETGAETRVDPPAPRPKSAPAKPRGRHVPSPPAGSAPAPSAPPAATEE